MNPFRVSILVLALVVCALSFFAGRFALSHLFMDQPNDDLIDQMEAIHNREASR